MVGCRWVVKCGLENSTLLLAKSDAREQDALETKGLLCGSPNLSARKITNIERMARQVTMACRASMGS